MITYQIGREVIHDKRYRGDLDGIHLTTTKNYEVILEDDNYNGHGRYITSVGTYRTMRDAEATARGLINVTGGEIIYDSALIEKGE